MAGTALIFEARSPHYESITHTPSGADVDQGALVTNSELNGFALNYIVDGVKGLLITGCKLVKALKVTATAIVEGEAIYYVDATDNVSSTGDTLLGYAAESAGAGVTHILMIFKGEAAFEKTDES